MFVALRGGGGPKRTHRQMFGAYGTSKGGRVRKPDHDSETSDSETSPDEDDLPSGSEDDEVDDPNVETARVMRVGGIEIRLDDRGGASRSKRGERRYVEPPDVEVEPPDDDDDDDDGFFDSDDSEASGSELSLDDDAVDDYVRNCMRGSDGDDGDEEDAIEETVEGDDPDALEPEIGLAARLLKFKNARRAEENEKYLRSVRDMNLSGGEVPSPLSSDLDSGSEDENEALKSGAYGAYEWSRGGVVSRIPERLGPSGARAAKKAAKAARKRGYDSSDDDGANARGLPRPDAIAETFRMMILSGGAYVGFQPVTSYEQLTHLANIAAAFGLTVELKGGGKRKHPLVRWTSRARVPRPDDARVARAVAAAAGEDVAGRSRKGYQGYAGKKGSRARRGIVSRTLLSTLESNFVSAGVMLDDSEDARDARDDEDDEDETDTRTDLNEDVHEDAVISDAAAAGLGLDPVEASARRSSAKEAETPDLGSGGPGKTQTAFFSSGVAVLDDGEDRERAREAMATNRGLRRAAESAKREAKLLESRRKKLGIHHLPIGGGSTGGAQNRTVGAGETFGAFEKHTSGFGSRMLGKMGFRGEGSGVGKSGTGIAEPIAAEMRAKRLGLGAEKSSGRDR